MASYKTTKENLEKKEIQKRANFEESYNIFSLSLNSKTKSAFLEAIFCTYLLVPREKVQKTIILIEPFSV